MKVAVERKVELFLPVMWSNCGRDESRQARWRRARAMPASRRDFRHVFA